MDAIDQRDLRILEKELKRLEEGINLRFEARDAAHKVNDIEILRRLDALNGEAGRIAAAAAESVRKDVYSRDFAELSKDIRVLRDSMSTNAGAQKATALWVSALVSLAFLVLNFVLRKV